MSNVYCYHKEFFIAGMLVTLFLFEGFMLFEDIIEEWFNQVINSLKNAKQSIKYNNK
ncbi:MAG TPA: hypothetical protein PKZ06_02495 [Candidatus Pacearchaeota archaeon]|nr:hypothetical protein [Candidatus Pacearchaeota archaeon]